MKKILVVVDMQNDFVDGALGSAEAQAVVPSVVEKIKNFDGEVVYTYDTHGENYLDTQEGRNLPVPHCIKGSEGWKLNPMVHAVSGKTHLAFTKPTFGSVGLARYIQNGNYGEVTLVGLCTDICVISNAMLIKAFCPEVKVSVDAICCAGVTPASHENALRAMQMCQINIENWEG